MRLPKPRMPPKRPRKSRARPKPGQEGTPEVPDGQDPNPTEPEPSEQALPGQKKRDWSPLDTRDMGTTINTLYAAKPHPKTRPVQQDPDDPRCSDEYLERVGLRSYRADPERSGDRKPTLPEEETTTPLSP